MNSLVSYEWLKEYVDLSQVTPDEFARRMSLSGPAVEKIIPQGKDLEKIVVGFVKEVLPHPNADKLRIATVDVGHRASDPSPLSIVCGGSNLEPNQWVAVALLGASVRWHGEGEPIVLEPAEIRGVKSEGMICAANEVGLFDAFPHAEREILDLGKALGWGEGVNPVRPGTPLADALGLSSDSVMDIEVTSNRVDAMGMVGMAREASAILDEKFLWKESKLGKIKGSDSVKVKISAKDVCSRYQAVKIDGVKVGPSPWWMKRRLLSAGLRPINNLVDISNYVMLELAQPLHMFDATKIEGGIDVRLAREGESIKALDGKEYRLEDSILVIADSARPLAIAGVMGGEETGVGESTTSIVIEAATFDPVCIRRGARKLNMQSDAQQRFEKGLSTDALPAAMARAIELVLDLAGGIVAGPVTDIGETRYKPLSFSITTDEVNRQIGIELPQKKMVDVLKRLGFGVKTTGKKITAEVPWWRDHDIEDGRDLVEEIARVEGYASIPAIIPFGLTPRPIDPELVWERRLRDASKAAGMTEVYSYSFVPEELLIKAGYNPSEMLHVQNPLTADFAVMRTTLLPSLLQVASENRERATEMRLFEVANAYYPSTEDGTWANLPDEQLEIGALFVGMEEPWRAAKGYVESLLQQMGFEEVAWKRLSGDAFWHPGRTVQAYANGELLATVGEVSPVVLKNFKLERVAMVDMPLEKIIRFAKASKTYRPIPAFPEAKRDLAVIVDRHVEYDDVQRAIRRVDSLVTQVEWFDTYEGSHVEAGKKSLAMHLTFSSPERTLESAEVDALMERIQLDLQEHFKASLRR